MDASPNKRQKISSSTSNVVQIVLTGGPCGGKSTAIEGLKTYLTEMGYNVYTIPEVPTILFLNGAVYPGEDISRRKELLALEETIMSLQLTMEDSFLKIARSTGKKCVVLCDRGVIDVKAYMPADVWQEVLGILNTDIETLLSRYAAVCHLTTAANGAKEYYTTANNHARKESAEEAMRLDEKTIETWNGHKVHEIIHNNNRTFDDKLEATKKFILEQIIRTIGEP